MDKIAVLIPCYNEVRMIRNVGEDWNTVLLEATIYVYDNNLIDDMASIAQVQVQ